MNAVHYSKFLDACIEWGRFLLSNGIEQRLDNELERFLTDELRPENDFTLAWGKLKASVEEAVESLTSSGSIRLSSSNYISPFYSMWPELDSSSDSELFDQQDILIDKAFLTLDLLVYLHLICNNSGIFKTVDNLAILKQEVTHLYDRLTLEQQLPTTRFVPYNDLRTSRLLNIPNDFHYCFPWYEEWHELPEDTLETLAAELPNIKDFAISGTFCDPAFIADLIDDQELFEKVQEEAWEQELLSELLPQAYKQAYALRLLAAADRQALRTPMPEAVVSSSRLGSALLLFFKDCISIDSLYAKFRATFCGLGLTEQQRRKGLKEISQLVFAGDTAPSWYEDVFSNWQQEDVASDAILAREFYDTWRHDITAVAQNPVVSILGVMANKQETMFWDLINKEDPLPSINFLMSEADQLVLEITSEKESQELSEEGYIKSEFLFEVDTTQTSTEKHSWISDLPFDFNSELPKKIITYISRKGAILKEGARELPLLMESLLLTPIPGKYEEVRADSIEHKCLSITIGDDTIIHTDFTDIDVEQEHHEEVVIFTGELPNLLKDSDSLIDYSCGIIVNDEVTYPNTFFLVKNKFHAEFAADLLPEQKDFKIVLIFRR